MSAHTPESQAPVAIVSGASRGIGRATALRLAQDGWSVAFCYQSSEAAAQDLMEALRMMGTRVYCQACDVTDPAAIHDFVDAAQRSLGPIDALVNNAGVTRDNPLVIASDADWHTVMRTNLDSVFHFSKRVAFDMMKRKRGVIVSMSSVAGVYGNPTQTNYSASKAGIIGFSKSLAKELGPYGIRVNVVAPGWIQTDMTKDLPPKIADRVKPNIPLRRLGSPQDVAALVAFLVSDQASYITAQVVHVDGGVMI
jgi:3-oxoacyl-[acyl-carrier protein] reductase